MVIEDKRLRKQKWAFEDWCEENGGDFSTVDRLRGRGHEKKCDFGEGMGSVSAKFREGIGSSASEVFLTNVEEGEAVSVSELPKDHVPVDDYQLTGMYGGHPTGEIDIRDEETIEFNTFGNVLTNEELSEEEELVRVNVRVSVDTDEVAGLSSDKMTQTQIIDVVTNLDLPESRKKELIEEGVERGIPREEFNR